MWGCWSKYQHTFLSQIVLRAALWPAADFLEQFTPVEKLFYVDRILEVSATDKHNCIKSILTYNVSHKTYSKMDLHRKVFTS